MMKWLDILLVGISFKENIYLWYFFVFEFDFEFLDVGIIYLWIFKVKRGYGFWEYVELRFFCLELEFSKFIGIYRYFYKLLLFNSLFLCGIDFIEEELEEILSRCFLFLE